MIHYSKKDLVKWAHSIAHASTTEAKIAVAKKIWEDGYRTAEAEVTYAQTPEEVQR